VARARDTRQFGPGPYVLGFQRLYWGEGFPFSVPAIAAIERLGLGQPVTLLTGDNGSGKSTILEGLCSAFVVRAVRRAAIGIVGQRNRLGSPR
jgi:flagellar biosynthesis/type III secretory pathway ATPase